MARSHSGSALPETFPQINQYFPLQHIFSFRLNIDAKRLLQKLLCTDVGVVLSIQSICMAKNVICRCSSRDGLYECDAAYTEN